MKKKQVRNELHRFVKPGQFSKFFERFLKLTKEAEKEAYLKGYKDEVLNMGYGASLMR